MTPPPRAEEPELDGDRTDWDVVVLGAGPAGLAAASRLAEGGAQVLLLDEQAALGGQIYRVVEGASVRTGLSAVLGPEYGHGASLAARLRRSGAVYWPSSMVWQVTPEREVWLTRNGRSRRLRARVVILALGAMERPVPLPGWTLPGVMTAGALQILLKTSGLVPRERLVLAGSGPLLYLLGSQLVAAGAPPAALLDTTASANELAALRHLPSLLGRVARETVAKGVLLKAAIRRAGVPMVAHVTDLRVEGEDQVQAVSYTARRRRHRVGASLVGLHEGVIPSQQATRSLGCEHRWDALQRCFRPVLDTWGHSSVDGVLVAGDNGGIGGARAAEHSGALAALSALHRLGLIDGAARDRMAAPERRGLAAHLALRPFLERLYAPRREILCPDDPVIVCRCEEIRAGQLRDVARRGCQGPNQAKSFLRAGMGPCQGRICGPVISEIIAAEHGRDVADVGYYRIRPPLKPVTLGELAAIEPGP